MRTLRYTLAARQHGVMRSGQIGRDSAAIRRAVLAGVLHPKYRGVYAVGHPRLSREGEWLAAVYAAGNGAALASFSAAALWKISRFREPAIQVATPKRRRPQPGFEIVTYTLRLGDVILRDAIPVTTVARTLHDLARTLGPEQVANVIHEAAFRRLFDERAIRAPGTVLKRALELHASGSAGTRSGLEDRFLKLVRGAKLPEPVINTHHLGFELDFRWPGLCVEIDGPGHERPRTRRDDRLRDAVLEGNGFTVLRFGERDLDRPREVLRELAAQQLAGRVAR